MVMQRFDVFRNPGQASKHVPFLLVVQSELLEGLPTRVVVPLARSSAIKGPSATILNPEFSVDKVDVTMLTQQLAAVPTQILRKHVVNLDLHRDVITRALDFLFSGI
jgi:toxin CcdB